MGIASMIGPAMFTLIYARAIDPANHVGLPGAPFLIAAAILAMALLVGAWVTRSR